MKKELKKIFDHRKDKAFKEAVEYFKNNIEKAGERDDFEAFMKFLKGGEKNEQGICNK